MKCQSLTFSTLLLAGCTLFAAGPCKTTAASVTMSPTYTYGGGSAASRIFPDSASAYVDGVSGVSAIINTGCTDDLILNVKNSTRQVGFSFQNVLATNNQTPSWIGMPFLSNDAYLAVRNLMYTYSASAYYQFTTVAQFSFTAPDGNADRVSFVNPLAQVYTPYQEANTPYMTSIVVVLTELTCPLGKAESPPAANFKRHLLPVNGCAPILRSKIWPA
jgi:hypothetical protein